MARVFEVMLLNNLKCSFQVKTIECAPAPMNHLKYLVSPLKSSALIGPPPLKVSEVRRVHVLAT